MTYGKLFFRLLREDFRRRAWSFFLGLFVFFLALPAAYQLLYGSMTFEAVPAVKAARELFSLGNSLIALITGAASVICAPGGFAYLFRRSTTDYYHSLPVRREFLFLVKYCCGILIYALPFGICLLLTLPLIAAKGGLTPEVLTDAYMLFVVHMTAYLVLYSVALTAVFLTGTLVVSILMAGTLFLYGVIVRALRIFLMDSKAEEKRIRQMLERARISAEIVRIASGSKMHVVLPRFSFNAELVFIEFPDYDTRDERRQRVNHCLIERELKHMPPCFLVVSNGEADILA